MIGGDAIPEEQQPDGSYAHVYRAMLKEEADPDEVREVIVDRIVPALQALEGFQHIYVFYEPTIRLSEIITRFAYCANPSEPYQQAFAYLAQYIAEGTLEHQHFEVSVSAWKEDGMEPFEVPSPID